MNETVAELLKGVPSIRLAPVVFKKLIELEATGDRLPREMYDRYPMGDDFLESEPDSPHLHDQIGKFYEVQCCRTCDVSVQFPDAPLVEFPVGQYRSERMVKFHLSEEMLSQYPLTELGAILLQEKLFNVLEPYIHKEYFRVREVLLD